MTETLNFGEFSIDTGAFELCHNGEPVAVEPLVLDLIIELARHPGLLRTRDDLIETVWNGRIVSDTTISTAIKSARKALGDTDTNKRIIRTVRGRGFQFIAETAQSQQIEESSQVNQPKLPVLHIKIVVLDEVISKPISGALEARLRGVLNRIPFLNILAGGAGTASVETATHLLEVSLSAAMDRVFADVSLCNLEQGLQRWTRHFSVAMQDGVAGLLTEIGPKAEPKILKEMSEFLVERGKDEPRALVLRAMQTIAERGWNPSSIATANDLLDRAIAKDKKLPLAYAITSLLSAIGHRVGMLRHDNSAINRAIENAEKALALESQSSAVLGLIGCAFCDVGQLTRGEPIIDRAIELDPMNGHAYAAKGAAMIMKGDFEGSLQHLRHSIEISPADSRLAVWGAILAIAELKCGQIDNARNSADRAISRDDVNYLPRLAAVAVHLTKEDLPAVHRALEELVRVHPRITSNEVLFFVGNEVKSVIWPIIETMSKPAKSDIQ